jgi:apolipoprotein N-acyltransferase
MIIKSRDKIQINCSFISLRDIGLALLSAALIILSMPPFDFWPLAFMALVPLYLAIREASVLRAAIIGWSCGFAVNMGGFFWGIELLEQFAHLSKEMSIVSVLGASAYQGTIWLVWAMVCNFLCRYLHLSWLIVAPLFLALLEAAIPMIFTWYLGFTVWRVWPLLQLAELGGPPAVSALLVLINIIIAEGVGALFGQHPLLRSVKLATWMVIIILCLGFARTIHVAKMRSDLPTMKVGIVQPNFGTMSMADQKRHGQQYIEVLRQATRELSKLGADLIIWPESAFPFIYDRSLKRENAPSHPLELKGGRNVRFISDASAHPFGKSFIYSSAIMVGESGRLMGMYDKNQLLASFEFISFKDETHIWSKWMRDGLPYWPDIETGQGSRMLQDANLRIAPFIYDEDIFQGSVNQVALKQPNCLITLANHALFGDSTAPHQALALATLRSVETRRDLVRATNTGVSSIGDALGRIHNETPFYEMIGDDHPDPILLVGEVAFMEIFALGPYTTPFFPYACALGLGILIVARIMREFMGRPQYDYQDY